MRVTRKWLQTRRLGWRVEQAKSEALHWRAARRYRLPSLLRRQRNMHASEINWRPDETKTKSVAVFICNMFQAKAIITRGRFVAIRIYLPYSPFAFQSAHLHAQPQPSKPSTHLSQHRATGRFLRLEHDTSRRQMGTSHAGHDRGRLNAAPISVSRCHHRVQHFRHAQYAVQCSGHFCFISSCIFSNARIRYAIIHRAYTGQIHNQN